MVQKTEKNEEIERVAGVFRDYIKASPYIEWLWSEKLGYILMQLSPKGRDIGESHLISDAGRLCWIMFNEVAGDVIQKSGSEHAVSEADSPEQAAIRKRLAPYIEQLPAYTYLVEKLFEA